MADAPKIMQDEFSIARGGSAVFRLIWTEPLSPDDKADLLDWLKLVERRIQRKPGDAPEIESTLRTSAMPPAVLWNGPVNKDGSPAPIQSMTVAAVALTTGKATYDAPAAAHFPTSAAQPTPTEGERP